MGAFFGDGLDLAEGFDGALLACALVEMAVFLTFSTAFATGFATGFATDFDCFAAGFATGFAVFFATGAALTGLAAGFLDFCKGMGDVSVVKNMSVTTGQALAIQPARTRARAEGQKIRAQKMPIERKGIWQAVWANIWCAVLAGSGRLF